jgi:hypothetical protein
MDGRLQGALASGTLKVAATLEISHQPLIAT